MLKEAKFSEVGNKKIQNPSPAKQDLPLKKGDFKTKKIAMFFGGNMSNHLKMIRSAARKLRVHLDLISYNRVCFDTESGRIKIRGPITGGATLKDIKIKDYDVLFFRTTGKHWEEVNLVLDEAKDSLKRPIIVDPLVLKGRPSDACKAYQMLALKRAGIDVPKTIYGSLWYLYNFMENQISSRQQNFVSKKNPPKSPFDKGDLKAFDFPVILKGSGGDRGTRVFKADNLEEMEKLVRSLRKSETEDGKRYMLQEYIPNDGDYRVLVLGDKVLGVMKRSAKQNEFLNNYSAGGKVEIADLPDEIKKMAVKAAEVCGLMVAGVDVAFRDYDVKKPIIWEVNKGPQFKGFMEATGIDVPKEIVKFLVNL